MNQVFSLPSIVLTICTKRNVGNTIVYYSMLLQYSWSYWIFALPWKRLSDTLYASLLSRSFYILLCAIHAAAFTGDFSTIAIYKCYRI